MEELDIYMVLIREGMINYGMEESNKKVNNKEAWIGEDDIVVI